VQGIGVVRHDFEDAAVDVRGSAPLLRLLQDDRERDRFVERERAVGAGQPLRRAYTALFVLRSYLK
jgi:hypothetical protein